MGINFKNSRILGSMILVLSVLILLTAKLIQVQITSHAQLLEESKVTNSYKVKIPAARGEILDRNGQKLVTNRQGNALTVIYGEFPTDNASRNAALLNTLNLLERRSERDKIVNNLPLELDGTGNIAFKADSEREIKNMKSKDLFYLASYATPQDCYNAMIEKYELQGLSILDALRVGNLRYELSRNGFSHSTPVTIAEDVSDETVLMIKENAGQAYTGVDVQIIPYREYVDGTIAPHLLGTTTKMTAELYADLKDKGYGLNDIVGESGIEQAMESYLRGEDGEITVKVDADGNISTQITKEPVQGHTIQLTIDKELQRVAQDQLAQTILNPSPNQKKSPNAGSVVVQDVNSGEILAAANYPTFDVSRYREDYDNLAQNSNLPLWNRFALGTYSPGSTFKLGIALAALETGVITPDYTFQCTGTVNWHGGDWYCQGGKSHGTVNVYTAIQESCNLFFYECAEKLGIQKMNEFCADLGFGQKTGVEITEAKGSLSGKEYADSMGLDWSIGQVYLSAIGQSYNQATMLQLASYTATIANGGTHYQSRFVKQILSYDCSEVVSTTKTNVLETLDIATNALTVTKDAMRRVVTSGTATGLNTGVSVPMAAKTGTSELKVNGVDTTNGFLVSYAPYESPEISIAAVLENSSSGAFLGNLEKEITNTYFASNEYVKRPQGYIELLP